MSVRTRVISIRISDGPIGGAVNELDELDEPLQRCDVEACLRQALAVSTSPCV